MHTDYVRSVPTVRKTLTYSSINSNVQGLSKYPPNQILVRADVQFILRQNSSPAVSLWNQTSFALPKQNDGPGMGLTFPLCKGKIRTKTRMMFSPKQVQNRQGKFSWILHPETNPLWSDALPCGISDIHNKVILYFKQFYWPCIFTFSVKWLLICF